jgi:hypothetical protein
MSATYGEEGSVADRVGARVLLCQSEGSAEDMVAEALYGA